jgi:hypothetical protein
MRPGFEPLSSASADDGNIGSHTAQVARENGSRAVPGQAHAPRPPVCTEDACPSTAEFVYSCARRRVK